MSTSLNDGSDRIACKKYIARIFGRIRQNRRDFRQVGGRTRTRTLDPLIKSQLLYQLSYAPNLPRRA